MQLGVRARGAPIPQNVCFRQRRSRTPARGEAARRPRPQNDEPTGMDRQTDVHSTAGPQGAQGRTGSAGRCQSSFIFRFLTTTRKLFGSSVLSPQETQADANTGSSLHLGRRWAARVPTAIGCSSSPGATGSEGTGLTREPRTQRLWTDTGGGEEASTGHCLSGERSQHSSAPS